MYVGPSKEFINDVFEPRLMMLLDEAPVLAATTAGGKRNKKLRKLVNGVAVRLALGNSPASLAGDSVGDIYIDEFDKMTGGMKGDADVFTLAKARAHSYADRKIIVTSTPKRGSVETERDTKTGLEFWKVAAAGDIESPIWAKFQEGTRHHWAWCCPHCDNWFVPRMKLLRYPENVTATKARLSTWIECPVSGCEILENEKEAMNAAGRYIAPGMMIENGMVSDGDLVDNTTLSLWVSGLASPFVSWGERAEQAIRAEQSGDSERRQGIANDVGELWAPSFGDLPDWQAILNRAEPYTPGVVPGAAIHLVITVDVQKDRLVFVIRAWGARASSWLIEYGYLYGDTSQPEVWEDLASKVTTPIGDTPIRLGFIDSGFRPGKKFALPLNRVYAFCRRFKRFIYPTKGSSHPMTKPLVKSKPDVTRKGDVAKYGLELIRLDTDHWKSLVQERLVWPLDQLGAWHLHQDIDEDYCRQIVSEVRTVNDNNRPEWIEKSRNNHFLDCEAMNAAAGFMLNVHHIRHARRDDDNPIGVVVPETPAAAVVAKQPKFERFANLAARLNR